MRMPEEDELCVYCGNDKERTRKLETEIKLLKEQVLIWKNLADSAKPIIEMADNTIRKLQQELVVIEKEMAAIYDLCGGKKDEPR